MPMRKFVYSLTLLLVTSLLIVSAQNTLTIHQKDGSKFGYGFSEKPVITYYYIRAVFYMMFQGLKHF